MLSSVHAARLIKTKRRDYRTGSYMKKPSFVADYNSKMGAIDKVEVILNTLNFTTKTLKWYNKFFPTY